MIITYETLITSDGRIKFSNNGQQATVRTKKTVFCYELLHDGRWELVDNYDFN